MTHRRALRGISTPSQLGTRAVEFSPNETLWEVIQQPVTFDRGPKVRDRIVLLPASQFDIMPLSATAKEDWLWRV